MDEGFREAVLGADSSSMTPAYLARRMSMPVDAVFDMLEDFEVCGHVVVGDGDGGLLVTLTEDGAEVLGLVLEDGFWNSLRRGGRVDPAAARKARAAWAGDLRCDRAGNPYPTILLGDGQQWDNLKRDRCLICKGLPIRENTYCMYCDRWGLDHEDVLMILTGRRTA